MMGRLFRGRGKVDVGPVLGAGRELDVRTEVTVPDFGAYSFPDSAEVALVVRRVGHGLNLEGTVDAVARGTCARCLDDVATPLHLEITERVEPGVRDPLAESNILTGDELDLGDLVRQSIDSALPIALLCNERCRGLCTGCGQKLDGECRCSHPNPETYG